MNAPTKFGRRLHDYDIGQGIAELIRHCPADQLAAKFKPIVDALALRAADFDGEGWWGYDSVEAGLLEASGCLEDVRAPGHERSQQEEYELQRDQRAFMFGGYR